MAVSQGLESGAEPPVFFSSNLDDGDRKNRQLLEFIKLKEDWWLMTTSSMTDAASGNSSQETSAGDRERRKLPAYQRIQSDIQKRIESGELKCGEPVASERELARSYGVSPMTARHALKELEREGLVVRRSGSGTYVAPPRIHFNRLISFTEQMAGRGFTACSRTLTILVTDKEEEISAKLSLPRGSRLIKLERLRFAGTEPLAVETCYLTAAGFPDVLDLQMDRRSLFNIFEEEFGVQLAYANEEVDATFADMRTAELLKIEAGAPLLRIRQLLYSTAGQSIAYSLGLYRSDRHSVLIRRFR